MQGYGRGARMKIERDHIEWLSGVRAGETLGSPGRHADPQPRLGQLGRRHGARGRRAGRAPPPARHPAAARATPTWSACSSTTGSTPATSSSAPAPARPRRGWRPARWPSGCSTSSASRSGATWSRSAASAPRRRPRCPVPLNEAADRSEVRVLDPAVEAEIIRRIDAAKKAGDTLGGEVEVVAARRRRRAREPRELGPEARRPAGRDADVDPGGEGGRDRAGLRGGAPARAPQVHDPIDPSREPGSAAGRRVAGDLRGGFRRPHQQRRRARGRDHHRRAARRPGGDEADLHPHVAAAHRRPRHRAAGQRPERALRRDRRAGDGRHRRGADRRSCWPTRCWRSSAATRSARCGATSTATWRRWAPAGRRSRGSGGGLMPRHVVLVGLPGVGQEHGRQARGRGAAAPAARHRRASWSGRWGCRWRRSSGWWASRGSGQMERDAVADGPGAGRRR